MYVGWEVLETSGMWINNTELLLCELGWVAALAAFLVFQVSFAQLWQSQLQVVGKLLLLYYKIMLYFMYYSVSV